MGRLYGRFIAENAGLRPGQVLRARLDRCLADFLGQLQRNDPGRQSVEELVRIRPGPPGALTRPQRFPMQIGFPRRVCMGAHGA